MSKYIKLDDAIHNINLEVIGRKEYTGDMKANLFFALDDLPTIDIVHCEECKHFNVDDYECENSEVAFDMSGGGDCSASRCRTDFCSAGERKDNE